MVIVKILILLFISTSVFADVMNLNEFMPTRLEDSKVIQGKTMEFQGSSDFVNEETDQIIYRENFRLGMSDKLQLEGFSNQVSGGDEKGSGEIHFGGQYDLVPQLGISPMIVLPTGKSTDGFDSEVRFNYSGTLLGSPTAPLLQYHVNYDWNHNNQRNSGERIDHNLYIVGMSYRYNDSGSLIIDVLREETQEKGEEINEFELGTQHEIGNHYLIGIGGGIGFGDESPHWSGIVSIVKMVPM